MERKIVLGIGGSSGSIYAKLLMDKLATIKGITVGVLMSENAIKNWEIEIGLSKKRIIPLLFMRKQILWLLLLPVQPGMIL